MPKSATTQEPLAVRTFSRRLRLMTIIILELLALELNLKICGLVTEIIDFCDNNNQLFPKYISCSLLQSLTGFHTVSTIILELLTFGTEP